MLRALANLVTPARASEPPSSGARPTSGPPEEKKISDIGDLSVDLNQGDGAREGQILPPQQVMGIPDLCHSGEEQSLRPESDQSGGVPRNDEVEEHTCSPTDRSSRMNEDTAGHSTNEGPDTSSQMENKDLHVGKKNLHRRAASAGVMPTVGQVRTYRRLKIRRDKLERWI